MFPALGNVCVERKCFVRREKLREEERRGEDCDFSKVRNNGLLKRVSKIFFFPGFPKEGEFLVALKNVLFGSIRVLFFNSPDKSYSLFHFPAKIGETGRKKISSGTKKLVIFLSLER